MRFVGCDGGAEAGIELFAPGIESRRLLERLGSFSPRLNRDLRVVNPRDGGEPSQAGPLRCGVRRAALIEGHGQLLPGQLRAVYPEVCVLIFAATLVTAAETWGEGLEAGRVFALGGRSYTAAQRDLLRAGQRLLPLADVDLLVAARTASLESGDAPLWLIVDLQVLAPHLVPEGQPLAPGGATLEALRSALAAVPGQRVVGFEVTGFPHLAGRNSLTALTGAELLRDNILTWWYH
jgi:hypothetical protein